MSRKHIICYTKPIFAWCQSHQNINILAPRITKKAAKQLSWCQDAKISAKLGQDDQADAKIPAAAGAKMPRYQPSWCQDIKIPSRARPSGPLSPISLGWGDSKNRPFWYQDSNMSTCHENILFIIHKLYLHDAKATQISIFWYPESPRKQLSS